MTTTQITLPRKQFTACLSAASKASAPKSNRPVLRCVRMSAMGSAVRLVATDCDHSSLVDCQPTERIWGGGEFLINPKPLLARLKASKAADCVIAYDCESGLVVDGAGASECLSVDNAQDHPGFASNAGDAISHGVVRSVAFVRLLGACETNTDQHATRFALGSVLVELHADGVVLVATDGLRMLWGTLGEAEHSQPIASNLLPASSIDSVIALAKLADRVAITITANGIRFEAVDSDDKIIGEVYSRATEGRFPNWRQVIPTQEHSVSFLAGDMLTAAKTCKGAIPALTPIEKKQGIPTGMTLTLTDSHVQWNSEAVKCCGAQWERTDESDYAGRLSVTLDCCFLAEFAAKCDKRETITMQFTDGSKPVTFRTAWCTQIVMLMSK